MFPGGDLRTLQACDGPADGEPGEACDVLSDGGEVDVGQAGQMAVVEPDDGDVAGDRDAGAEEEVEYAGRAAVVEGQYGGGARAGGRQGSGGLGATHLALAATASIVPGPRTLPEAEAARSAADGGSGSAT
ncbi:hypothetical protein ACM01_37540 [Streptomyces viridochromogenes]|uniref:Uncharacterized protein n=1 Tax=Streptomyces viridochromogenes TaxID=1938 RepID=A0A0J7YZH7_STRVR|nr:hypothetical protein ACM01_37540 [Streptomyces viridochromogenes]